MVVVGGPLAAAKAELHPARVAMAVQTVPGKAFVSEPTLKQVSNIAGNAIVAPLSDTGHRQVAAEAFTDDARRWRVNVICLPGRPCVLVWHSHSQETT